MGYRSGYTGRLFEEEVLGVCNIVWDGSYVPYRRAMEMARQAQPWDPSDPELPVANDLHALVALALGLTDWSELRLYTSIGTPLDRYHSVDGWFEWKGKVVTVDVTKNPSKAEYRADVIIQFSILESRGKMAEVAEEVAGYLKVA